MMSGWILLVAPLACIALMGTCAWMMLRMHNGRQRRASQPNGDRSAVSE